jgi:proliferating cell nuclear antigen
VCGEVKMLDALISADILRTGIEAILTLVPEARFRILEEGVVSRAVDPANVAMVSVELKKDAFDSFSATEAEVGVDVNRLYDILKMARKEDEVELVIDEGSNTLKVQFSGLRYTYTLIDPSAIRKEPKVPNLELPARITMKTDDFKKAILAGEKISDHVVLKTDENNFYIEAEGDTDQIVFSLTKAELVDFVPETARSMFSLDYLKEFVKPISRSEFVTIHLGTDYPARFEFTIADGRVKVEYLLAPRIESE